MIESFAENWPTPDGPFVAIAALYGAVRAGVTYKDYTKTQDTTLSEFDWNWAEGVGYLSLLFLLIISSEALVHSIGVMIVLAGVSKSTQMLGSLIFRVILDRQSARAREAVFERSFAQYPTKAAEADSINEKLKPNND